MKNLIKVMLALTLITSTVFANNGENGVMDKLTNDSAFEHTSLLFNEATADDSYAGEALLSGIVTIPAVIVESVVWIIILPLNAISMAVED